MNLSQFFHFGPDPGLLLSASYDWRLVALSVVIPIAAAILAMYTVGLAQRAIDPRLRTASVAGGALALGLGTWSMHFVGMLALRLCAPVDYNPTITAVSVAPGLLAAWAALHLLVGARPSAMRLVQAGIWMGSGIGLMHYLGMQAMDMEPLLRYRPLWFLVSLVVVIGLAISALWIGYSGLARRLGPLRRCLLSGTVMGIAIASMHYVAMKATVFIGPALMPQPVAPFAVLELSAAVTVGMALLVLCVMAVTTFAANQERLLLVNRSRDELSEAVAKLRQSELMLDERVQSRTRELECSRAAAQALADELRMMADVVRHTRNAVSISDTAGRITWINEGFTRITGYTAADAIGREPGELLGSGQADPQALQALRDAIAAGLSIQVEILNRAKDGHLYWTSTEVQPRHDPQGRHTGFMEVGIDISERKRLEDEVRRSAELLRGAFNAIDEAFVLYDPDDRLVFCNEKYRQIYASVADLMVPGVTFEALIRRGVALGQYTDATGNEEAWIAERVAAHRASNSTIIQRHPGGRVLRIVEHMMPDGHIVGFRIDITELMQATEQANAASRAKSQFLANMSHEIRTPMNAILGMLKLLHSTALDDRQFDYASKAETAARSLLGLLNDILDSSKMDAGKMDLDPQPFELERLLRALSVILSGNRGDRPVEVLFDIDPAVPAWLVGDALRLQQVLINLSGNALKFTERGEVVVRIRTQPGAAPDVRLRFEVQDTGVGIAPEHQRHIFDGFSQAETSTTRRFGGTGLGLAISKRLVAMMGGTLELESTPGVGSNFHFTITLPAGTPPQQPPGATAGSLPRDVLVVDDHAIGRNVLVTAIEAWGGTADTAATGVQALACIEARREAGMAPYQVVLMDWEIPGMDGWETIDHLRTATRNAPPPVIVMVTLHGREELARRSPDEQARLGGYLVKPVTASMVREVLSDALDGRGNVRTRMRTEQVRSNRLRGMRLLVVEDNHINQQVAQELLQAQGAYVTLADNGQAGVAAVARAQVEAPFDAVLMDLQMPVMDGFAATRAIRHDLGLASLPIVAMTANAMASDRAECLAGGMDEHIGKPFDLQQVVAVLRTVTGRSGVEAATAMASGPPAPGEPPGTRSEDTPTAEVRIDVQGALARLSGMQSLYTRSVREFQGDLAHIATQLRASAQSAAWRDTVRLLHMVKGTAATLGADALAAQAAVLERACQQRQGDALSPTDITRLGQLARQTSLALDVVLTTLEQPASTQLPGPVDGRPARQQLQSLEQWLGSLVILLDDCDMAAVDSHRALRADLAQIAPALAADLDQAITRLDFPGAMDICRAALAACRAAATASAT